MVALMVAVVITLQVRRPDNHQQARSEAFAHLAAGDFVAAERSFRAAIGDLQPDPLCILGLSILQDLPTHVGKKAPPTPSDDYLVEAVAAFHARQLLVHGLPARAGAFASRALNVIGKSRQLTQIQMFANGWLAAQQNTL